MSEVISSLWVTPTTQLNKQPRALYYLSLSNLWERFGYYTTKGILVLYMVKILLFSHEKAYSVFSAFTAFVFLAPMFGGYLADNILSPTRAVLWGGILLAGGYFLLSVPGTQFFYIGLAAVILGNGFFMPNISGVLGHLYEKQDPRREGGFSILYSAVNIGAFIPPLIAAGVISLYGWHAAFLMAGLGTSLSVGLFYFLIYRHAVLPSVKIIFYVALWAGLSIAVILLQSLVKNSQIASTLLFAIGGLLLLITIRKSFQFDKLERNRLLACLMLTGFSILFCVLCEQAAMSLTIFTEYHVNRVWLIWSIPAVTFLSLNPFFVITFAPLVSKFWIWLDTKKLNPSIPAKFALGTVLVGFGFVILPLSIALQSNGLSNLWWVVLSYFLQSMGELLIYPVGLSMMTELSPKQMVGLMIGVWYFATAIANALAGIASSLTVATSGTSSSFVPTHAYASVFGVLGWAAILAGMVLLALVKPLKKLIQP